jgi:phosphogluconate dehydratase
MATAIGLSHNMFDGALFLGVCDKIVPGLLIGALSFGHLPAIFVPAGPMPSGITNQQKSQAREKYAMGLISREELLAADPHRITVQALVHFMAQLHQSNDDGIC